MLQTGLHAAVEFRRDTLRRSRLNFWFQGTYTQRSTSKLTKLNNLNINQIASVGLVVETRRNKIRYTFYYSSNAMSGFILKLVKTYELRPNT